MIGYITNLWRKIKSTGNGCSLDDKISIVLGSYRDLVQCILYVEQINHGQKMINRLLTQRQGLLASKNKSHSFYLDLL